MTIYRITTEGHRRSIGDGDIRAVDVSGSASTALTAVAVSVVFGLAASINSTASGVETMPVAFGLSATATGVARANANTNLAFDLSASPSANVSIVAQPSAVVFGLASEISSILAAPLDPLLLFSEFSLTASPSLAAVITASPAPVIFSVNAAISVSIGAVFREYWRNVYFQRQAVVNALHNHNRTLANQAGSVATVTADALVSTTARVTAAENTIVSQSNDITVLGNSITGINGTVSALSGATQSLDSRVSSAEGTINSQSGQITNLNASLNTKTTTFVQGTEPSGANRVTGDLWINSSDNNKLYTWNGSWVLRPMAADGISVFAQGSTPSTTGRKVGDLWFHTGDNNRQFMWNGSAWAEVTDPRIAATATATNNLSAQVNHGTTGLSAIASNVTNLTTTVNGNTSTINSYASSINGLNAKVGVTLDVNNYMTGWSLNNNGASGAFNIRADMFSIVAPGGGARTEYSSGNWRVYDAGGVLRVRMGVW